MARSSSSSRISSASYIFDVGGPHTFRTIYMDGRSHPKDLTPSYYGHSIGWWEGDTLVVDSVGFNESFWWDRRGLPHTEQLHFVERFTRTDSQNMRYEFTVDDPGAYTKPYSGTMGIRASTGTELFEYICQQANYAHELMVGQAESVEPLDVDCALGETPELPISNSQGHRRPRKRAVDRTSTWPFVRFIVEITRLNHVAVCVTDIERSKRFYGGVLGLKEIARPAFPFAGAWYELADGRQFHLIVHEHHADAAREPRTSICETGMSRSVSRTSTVRLRICARRASSAWYGRTTSRRGSSSTSPIPTGTSSS